MLLRYSHSLIQAFALCRTSHGELTFQALGNPPVAELIDVASGEVTYDSVDSVCETLKVRAARCGS